MALALTGNAHAVELLFVVKNNNTVSDDVLGFVKIPFTTLFDDFVAQKGEVTKEAPILSKVGHLAYSTTIISLNLPTTLSKDGRRKGTLRLSFRIAFKGLQLKVIEAADLNDVVSLGKQDPFVKIGLQSSTHGSFSAQVKE